MAQKIITVLTDDLDGKELKDGNGETVAFMLDGTTYELDLSKKNADNFRGVFQDYIAVARKVGRKTGTAGKRTTQTSTKEIRDWARSHGFANLSDRGRIPANIMDAWDSREK